MSSVILDLLVKTMKDVSVMNISGFKKKTLVLELLFDELDMSPIIEELLENVIDLLIDVENGKLVFNKKIKKSFLYCCLDRQK